MNLNYEMVRAMIKVVNVIDNGRLYDPFEINKRIIMEDKDVSKEQYEFLEKKLIGYINNNIIDLYKPIPKIMYSEPLTTLRVEIELNIPQILKQVPPREFTQKEV